MIRNYFGFGVAETNGFLVLMCLSICALFAPSFYAPTSNYISLQEDRILLDSLVLAMQLNLPDSPRNDKDEQKIKIENKIYLPFDPNTADAALLKASGIPEYLAVRIENYTSKGGKFKYKADLKKIYGFPEELYIALVPYIQLPENKENIAAKQGEKSKNIKYLEINTATKEQLIEIRGIGEATANRIMTYRDKIGGFVNWEQLQSVYQLPSAIIDSIKKYGTLNPDAINKININTISYQDLSKNLLFKYKEASLIINYRDVNGKYTSVEDFRKIKMISDTLIQKVAPYLVFE